MGDFTPVQANAASALRQPGPDGVGSAPGRAGLGAAAAGALRGPCGRNCSENGLGTQQRQEIQVFLLDLHLGFVSLGIITAISASQEEI